MANPIAVQKMNWDEMEHRFVQKGEHWHWTGPKDGYGLIGNKWSKPAHREFYKHYVGPIATGEQVQHICNIPNCIRPDHLKTGVPKKNSEYMVECGRAAFGNRNGSYTHPEKRPRGITHGRSVSPEKTARGEKNGSAKLKADDIPIIFGLYSDGVGKKEIGKRFGVSDVAIHYVLTGKNWGHTA
jgi:HNH endonuclease